MGTEVCREELIANEVFMLADGGEMPEVAFHSAVYYLTKDEDGPALELRHDELALLREAVTERYRIIVLRDLCPANKGTSIYRGIERSAANWHRLKRYGRRENIDLAVIRLEVAEALLAFLRHEYDAVIRQGEESCVNCSGDRLCAYAKSLGLALDAEMAHWRRLF